jgi:sucrose phosphorylase
MKNQVQLITYIDRLSGGGIRDLRMLLSGTLAGVFGGVHLLPFYTPIDGADAGFDPIDHTEIDPRLGTWVELRSLGVEVELMADLIVNHISSRSPQFLDFSRNGSASPYADMILTFARVFPEGATENELLQIYRPRPGLPFTYTTLADGHKHLLWTTFTSQQIDIDVLSAQGGAYLESILNCFHEAGIRAIRLDAVGYAIKQPGTTCFMIPETFGFIDRLTQKAHALGIEVLVEIHSHYMQQIEIACQVDWVYDFALPPLLLHALYQADAAPLANWLSARPDNSVTVLDTHDGIGVIDVGAGAEGAPGLLEPDSISTLVDTIHTRSNGESRLATGAAANNLDLYQVNCTYFDALGGDESAYLLARAVQFFVPGVPQVYYAGLLAEHNDMELLRRTGVGRDINRHYFTKDEIERALAKHLVRQLIELIRFRNSHPAFSGTCAHRCEDESTLQIEWKNSAHWAVLQCDFSARSGRIKYSLQGAEGSGEIMIGSENGSLQMPRKGELSND